MPFELSGEKRVNLFNIHEQTRRRAVPTVRVCSSQVSRIWNLRRDPPGSLPHGHEVATQVFLSGGTRCARHHPEKFGIDHSLNEASPLRYSLVLTNG